MSKYPLEPLRRLRNREVDAQRLELAARVQAVRGAERSLDESAAAVETARGRRQSAHAEEIKRSQAGAQTVGDWQTFHAFEQAARAREQQLKERQKEAQGALELAHGAEEQAQLQLGQANASAQLIERHHEQFERVVERQRGHAEEEEALEVWGSGTVGK